MAGVAGFVSDCIAVDDPSLPLVLGRAYGCVGSANIVCKSALHFNPAKNIIDKILAGVAGFEPTDARVKVLCLTTWRHP